MERDPAARGVLEVVLCYPGFHALVYYRMSNWLWRHQFFLLGRVVSQIGKMLTTIEIHPGARIGERFVIDHGTGVVIGETAVIGDDVTLYHAVTLGGISPSEDSQSQVGVKRHPTLEKGVIVGSGAQVLGPITIGMNTRIGANSVVTKDIPPAVTVVGIPARTMMPRDKKKAHEFQAYGTPADDYPDPVVQAIDNLRGQVAQLMKRIEDLEIVVEAPMAAEERGSGGQSRGKNEKGKQPAA
ncbi:MAG: Serine acetyltransferase [Alphaproteobacteria bacterium MarineAlpha3_Bin4]|nr:MAG: Serine acetyltransferase [Alphaproteobacteria bacterium MarineAlpha3_Bin4]